MDTLMPPSSASVAIIMGSQSDWATLRHGAETLTALGISHTTRIVSAHRTPKRLYDFATTAKAKGFKVIIAAAGGAAHLPGMTAAMTPLPVLGVPIESQALKGMDSGYRWEHWPLAAPAPLMQRCWRPLSSRSVTRRPPPRSTNSAKRRQHLWPKSPRTTEPLP
jgi:phosphoribosylaminoimidazole carboxylase PurE protein